MALDHQNAQVSRWKLVILAVTLSLSLMVLTILDSSRTLENKSLMVAALVLLGILIFLAAYLLLQTRQLRTAGTAAPAIDRPSDATTRLILLALTLLAGALRLYDLGQESMWVDEVWTATWAEQPLRSVLQTANPLAYLVAHFTLLIGRSEFALRFAPALAGIAVIPATYLLGRTLYGRKEGLTAAALMGISMYAIERSQELRFYPWLMLFSTLTLHFLLRGLEQRRWLDWAAFALVTALNLYTHPFAFFVLASEGLYTLWFLAKTCLPAEDGERIPVMHRVRAYLRQLMAPAAAMAVALIAFLPMLSLSLSFNNSLWVVSAGRTQHLPLGMSSASWLSWPVAFGTYGMLADYLNLRSVPFLVYLELAIFILGLLSVGRRAAMVLLWFLVPLPIVLATKYWVQPRYFSYFLPMFVIVTAAGLTWLAAAFAPRRREQAILLIALTGLVAMPSLVQLPAYYGKPQEDQWREVTAFVESNYGAGDLVFVTSAYDPTPLPFDWYATVAADKLPRQVFPQGPQKGVLTQLEQLDLLPAATQGHDRVWFVFCYVSEENQALIAEVMQKKYAVVDEWHFVGLDLVLFQDLQGIK
jgi:hypothetical protein